MNAAAGAHGPAGVAEASGTTGASGVSGVSEASEASEASRKANDESDIPTAVLHAVGLSSAGAPLLAWDDGLLLGLPQMDAEHREFVERVHALQTAEPHAVQQRLAEFAQHARAHFAAEDRQMLETDFPPRQCHFDEHAAVLQSVAEVQALVAAGRTDIVQGLADELARWFPGHAQHLDSALAAWVSKLKWGAKPLVLKRNMQA
jgi:hemerythrin